jgi:hypothetical protein
MTDKNGCDRMIANQVVNAPDDEIPMERVQALAGFVKNE